MVPVTRGVPQGSFCEPGFWNILMDDLFETDIPRGAMLTCFADDCLIAVVDRNIYALKKKVQIALKKLQIGVTTIN